MDQHRKRKTVQAVQKLTENALRTKIRTKKSYCYWLGNIDTIIVRNATQIKQKRGFRDAFFNQER